MTATNKRGGKQCTVYVCICILVYVCIYLYICISSSRISVPYIAKMSANISHGGYKCVCLNARGTVNKKNELNIMTEDIDRHIIGITESWANKDISDAELGLTGYVMFRKDRLGRRGEGILYIKESIQAYEIKLEREADCEEAVWCNIFSRNSALNIRLVLII